MKEEQAKLVVQVQPGASRNKVTGFKEGVLYIRIAEPPVRGKANQELIKYLSGILGIDKSRIAIQKGTTSKRKLITISQLNQDQVVKNITSWLAQHKT
jgi:uncharacterized protein (TIGR00251 family)